MHKSQIQGHMYVQVTLPIDSVIKTLVPQRHAIHEDSEANSISSYYIHRRYQCGVSQVRKS